MIKIVQTEDGSATLYDTELKVHYRSTQGAAAESQHVFLQGTKICEQPMPWQILELGLGGGINFLQTAQAFLQRKDAGTLHYHTVEYAPIEPELLIQESYAKWLLFPSLLELLQEALKQARIARTTEQKHCILRWKQEQKSIELHVYPTEWSQIELPSLQVQAIYHDPFDPQTNPTSWSENCFRWLFSHAHPDSILATYGASGHARRAMQRAGFYVAKTKGYGRKREMTLASPSHKALSEYKLTHNQKDLVPHDRK